MPKQTFLNLPEEKKNKILLAAQNEFLRVPFQEASINQMIKEAQISRGSFYQYFEDKEDVFDTVLNNYRGKFFEDFMNTLEKNNGDLFQSVDAYVNRALEIRIQLLHGECCNISLKGLWNVLSDSFVFEKIWGDFENGKGFKEDNRTQRFYESVDKENLDVIDEGEIMVLFNILGFVAREAVANAFAGTNEEINPFVIECYNKRMASLKKHYSK